MPARPAFQKDRIVSSLLRSEPSVKALAWSLASGAHGRYSGTDGNTPLMQERHVERGVSACVFRVGPLVAHQLARLARCDAQKCFHRVMRGWLMRPGNESASLYRAESYDQDTVVLPETAY